MFDWEPLHPELVKDMEDDVSMKIALISSVAGLLMILFGSGIIHWTLG